MLRVLLALGLATKVRACVYCHNCEPTDPLCYVLRSAFTGKQLAYGCASSLRELHIYFEDPAPQADLDSKRWCAMARNDTVLCLCTQAPYTNTQPYTTHTYSSQHPTTTTPTTRYKGPATPYIDPWYLRDGLRSTPTSTRKWDPTFLHPFTEATKSYRLFSFTLQSSTLSPTSTLSTFSQALSAPSTTTARLLIAHQENIQTPPMSSLPTTTPSERTQTRHTTAHVLPQRVIQNFQSAINDKALAKAASALTHSSLLSVISLLLWL